MKACFLSLLFCWVGLNYCFSGDIPSFKFRKLDSTVFQKENLSSKPVVFVFVDPSCTYSQDQTYHIKNNIDSFKNVLLIFVVTSDITAAKTFSYNYDLDKLPVMVLVDENNTLENWMSEYGSPTIFIYDEELNKLESYRGYTKVDDLYLGLQKATHPNVE